MKYNFRVYLRAFEPDDYKKIHVWRQDDEIAQNFGGARMFSSTLNEKKWIEDRIFDKNNVSCAICLKENDEFVGCIFLNYIDLVNRSGNCPLYIGEKSLWGKGYANEAKILMLKFAFFERGLIRVWGNALIDNVGSVKMHEKCGFKKEGVLRKAIFKNGNFHDLYAMAVLKEDFLEVLKEYE